MSEPRNANGQRVLLGPHNDTKPWLHECVICGAPLGESRVLGDFSTCSEEHERARKVMDRLKVPATVYWSTEVFSVNYAPVRVVITKGLWNPSLPLEDQE